MHGNDESVAMGVPTTSGGGRIAIQQRPALRRMATDHQALVAQRTAVDNSELHHLAAAVRHRQRSRYERLVKPLIDRLAAAVLLVVLSPVLLFVSVGVLLTVGQPLLFRQVRVGRGSRPFHMLKFRTMLPDRRARATARATLYEGPERRATHKSLNDPRHTVLGRWLRKTSLDELPQLSNVLRGQMSLVGPRPELIQIVERYVSWQHTRHSVKPGVTGLWQTTERGRGRPLHDCVDLDLRYISQLSFSRDMLILLRTPLALLRNKGVI